VIILIKKHNNKSISRHITTAYTNHTMIDIVDEYYDWRGWLRAYRDEHDLEHEIYGEIILLARLDKGVAPFNRVWRGVV